MPKYPTFLSDLAEPDRTHIKLCIKRALLFLRSCESRLRRYEAENAKAESESVIKLLTDLKYTGAIVDAMMDELIEKHGLPNDIKQIDDEFRQDMRNVLTGVFPPE